jgi:WD40 repeat protein
VTSPSAILFTAFRLITGNEDGTLCVWNLDLSLVTRSKPGSSSSHTNTVTEVLFLPETEGRRDCFVLSASFDGCIGLWEVEKTWSSTSKAPSVKLILQRKVPVQNFEGVTFELLSLILLQPTGGHTSFVLCGDNSGSVNVFATHFIADYQKIDQAHLRCFAAHDDAITCMASDGNFFFTGCDDGSIRVWEGMTMSLMSTLKQHLGSIRSILVVGSHGFLVSCGSDGFIRVWNYAKALVLQVHTHNEFELRSLSCTHKMNLMVGTLEGHIVTFPLLSEATWRRLRVQDTSIRPPGEFFFNEWCMLVSSADVQSALEFETHAACAALHGHPRSQPANGIAPHAREAAAALSWHIETTHGVSLAAHKAPLSDGRHSPVSSDTRPFHIRTNADANAFRSSDTPVPLSLLESVLLLDGFPPCLIMALADPAGQIVATVSPSN